MRGGEKKNGSEPQVQVQMFGEFSISINGNVLTNFKGSTKRVWLLIQYLLAHRFEPVPIDVLVAELWNGKTCGDPKNALKNLIYRARVLLRDLSKDDRGPEFILFNGSTYCWNNGYSCTTDAEEFLELCRRGEDLSKKAETRVAAYKNAIALYCGGFLEKSSGNNWVVELANQYAKIYCGCVKKVCSILFDLQDFAGAADICRKALEYIPYEIPVHHILLQAFVNQGKRKEAYGLSAGLQKTFQQQIRHRHRFVAAAPLQRADKQRRSY